MYGSLMISHFVQHRSYILVSDDRTKISNWIYCQWNLSVAVSFDRYVAVENPLKYKQKMTKRTIFIIIGCIWLISVLLSYGPVLLGVYRQPENADHSSNSTECNMRPNRVYSIISSSTSFYIPLIIILFLYGRIFITARKHSHELQKLESIIKRLHSNEKFVLENAKWKKNIKAIRTLGRHVFIDDLFEFDLFFRDCRRCVRCLLVAFFYHVSSISLLWLWLC